MPKIKLRGNQILMGFFPDTATLASITSLVKAGTKAPTILGATSGTLSIKQETKKHDPINSGRWQDYIRGRKSWTLSASHMLQLNTTTTSTLNIHRFYEMLDKDSVWVSFGFTAGGLTHTLVGKAILQSIDYKGQKGQFATFSVKLQGTGELTEVFDTLT